MKVNAALLLILAIAIGSTGIVYAQEKMEMNFDLRYDMPDDHPTVKSFRERGLTIGRSNNRYGTFLTAVGPSNLVMELSNAIRAYNPSPNIEVTIHMIEASRRDGEERIPEMLKDVVEKLSDTFGYPRFSLLDTIVIRHRSANEAQVSGVLPTALPELDDVGKSLSIFYTASMMSSVSTAVQPNVIEIEHFKLSMQVPYLNTMVVGDELRKTLGFKDVGFVTSITCREGQQVVLGKANVNGSNDAFFVVVSARVVE